jgi:hypothetical protein
MSPVARHHESLDMVEVGRECWVISYRLTGHWEGKGTGHVAVLGPENTARAWIKEHRGSKDLIVTGLFRAGVIEPQCRHCAGGPPGGSDV